MRVYLDMVMLLNFLVDLLLLLGTNRLSGFSPGWKRTLPAAVLGGVYGGVCMLPGFSFLGGMAWRLIFLMLMSVIAFGWDITAIKRAGVFLLLSMALGGMVMNIGNWDFLGILIAAVLIWILCRIGFGGSIGGREFVQMEIHHGQKTLRLLALRDSGNTLTDPITGEQVLVVDAAAAEELTGLTTGELEDPLQTMGKLPGLRLIPYRTVGRAGGMLLAMRFKDVKIGNRKGPAVVAFTPHSIGRGEGYRALTGGALV